MFWRSPYEKAPTDDVQIGEAPAPRPRLFWGIPERPLLIVSMISNLVLLLCLAINTKRQQSGFVGPGRSVEVDGYVHHGMNDDIKRVFAYSPILDSYDMKPGLRAFNGALRDNSTIWRQPPSPEVDEAWDYISTEGFEVITVSESDVVNSGKDPAISLKAPGSWGAGDDAYIVQVEVFHQIHCLNELRKEMDHDYYYNSPPDELHKSHKRHCIHMLLQSLMCSADVGIITHNWVRNENIPEPKIRPMPDFNVVKKCADFDGLLEWARKNAVKDLNRKFSHLRYVPGVDIVPGDGYA